MKLLPLLFIAIVVSASGLIASDAFGKSLTLTVNDGSPVILDFEKVKTANFEGGTPEENLQVEVVARYSGYWAVRFQEWKKGEIQNEKLLKVPKKQIESQVFPSFKVVAEVN